MITTDKTKLTTPNQRLKYIRSLLRITRSYIQENHGLPEVTLKSWENGTTNITKVGVERCVEIYRKEGLILSENWIMEGIGLDPKNTNSVSHYFSTPTPETLPFENDEIAMIRDANIFKKSYKNAVIMIVSNDDMRPYYRPGDYVGGKTRYGDNINSAVNKDCIIYLKNGAKFFRRLIKNSYEKYNLTCLNPNESTSEPVLYNVDIDCVAPVIWHRRKDE